MDLMPIYHRAYEHASREHDRGKPGPLPARRAQRAVQDVVLAERHREWDLKAQDTTMKYERFHFAVVGEGTQAARTNYERGYGLVDWSK